MKCIECDNERDSPRGDGTFRTRCRTCWNRYNREVVRPKHKKHYAEYHKKYRSERIKSDEEFKKKVNIINNKSNKKAQLLLKESYLKNLITKGRKWQKEFEILLEAQKQLIQIKRWNKAQ